MTNIKNHNQSVMMNRQNEKSKGLVTKRHENKKKCFSRDFVFYVIDCFFH